MKKFLAIFVLCLPLAAQTNISISSTPLQTGVKRIGVNLGGPVVPYGSQQLMKNLIGTNPGFNNSIVSSTVPCDKAATTTTCQTGESHNYTSGWWGSYTATMRVMTGTAAGCTATITNFVPNTFTFSALSGTSPVTGSACTSFAQSGTPSTTNYIQVTKAITSSNSGTSYNPTWGWQVTSTGSSPTYTVVADAPPSPDAESTYTQSLQMSATGSDVAQISVTADASSSVIAGRNFIDMNGVYTVSFWAKSVSGTSPVVNISVGRNGTVYYFHSFAITGSWAQYTGTFTASETGNQTGSIVFAVATAGAETVEVDNFSLTEPATAGNATNFRDSVVSALKTLQPGVIRMWDGISETNTLDNMLVNQFARAPANFRSYSINGYPGYYNYISYSIPDVLQLCQAVGSECWITIPVTFTPTDVSNLIDYLSGDATTTYGARRIAQGQTTPWTSVSAIPKIYLELGNEQWNNGFTGGDMAYNPPAYGALAQQLFAVMKAKTSYVSAKMSLVLGAQFQGTYYIQGIQNQVSNNDLIDVAPYLMNNVTDASTPNLWNSTLAEPQLLYSAVGTAVCMEDNNYSYAQNSYAGPITACPTEASYSITGPSGSVVHNYGGGIMAQNFQAEANSSHSVPFAFYETSVDGTGSEPSGGLNQAQLNAYLPSLGVGLMNANAELEGMAKGVLVQNVFQLGQDYYQLSGINYLMWGIVEDMGGPTNGRRPTFLAMQLANNAITPGGNMLAVTQTGTPTYTLGTPSATATYANDGAVNSVAGNNIQGVRSFAFSGSNGYGLVMFNNTSSPQAVTFSGANAPAGTVTVNTLTSASPSDNNETATTTVVPVTSTLSSPTGTTLPAYSEVVMTWNGSSSSPCSITTSSLPAGNVGAAYSQTLSQTGCATSSWTVSTGTLPAGLSLAAATGVISGTPTAAGTSSFTISYSTGSQPYTLVISPATTITCAGTVVAGASVNCLASTSVTWTLPSGSVGTLSGANPSASITYNAPSGVVAQASMGGCPVAPNDSLWTVRVDALPADTNSAAKIARLQSGGFTGITFKPAWGISQADSSTPLHTFKTYYDDLVSTSIPFPAIQWERKESGNHDWVFGWKTAGNKTPDQHVLTVSNAGCGIYELYDPYQLSTSSVSGAGTTSTSNDGTTTGVNAISIGVTGWANGTPYAALGGKNGSGTTAAGTPLAPLTIHIEELKSCINSPATCIRHAIALDESASVVLATNASGQAIFKWPASANSGCAYPCSGAVAGFAPNGDPTNFVLMGSRLRLKAAFAATSGVCASDSAAPAAACTTAKICTTGNAAQNAMCTGILTAAANYGFSVNDIGGTNTAMVSSDVYNDRDAIAALKMVGSAGISSSNLEVVNIDPLIYAPGTSYQTTPYQQYAASATYGGITYSGAQNSYVQPVAQAVVTTSAGSLAIIAIQPVQVGSKVPRILDALLSGVTYNLSTWTFVTPLSVSQAVNWTLSGTGCGSVSGSSYTAPATSVEVSGCDLRATSAYDAAAFMDFYFTVVPGASGALRIDTGSAATTVDGVSNTWYPDPGLNGGGDSVSVSPGHFAAGSYANQYATAAMSSAGVNGVLDLAYDLVMPPGNYKVHLLFSLPDAGVCTFPCGNWTGHSDWSKATFVPVAVDVNNSTIVNHFDWGYPSGYLWDTGSDITVPATVGSDGILRVAVGMDAPDMPAASGYTLASSYTGPNFAPALDTKYNTLAGIEVVPDTSAPHLTIDYNLPSQPACSQFQAQVCPAETLQPIYAIPWYFTPAATTWTITSDPWGSSTVHSSVVVNADGSATITAGTGTIFAGQSLTVKATSGAYSATATFQSTGTQHVIGTHP